MLLTISAIFFLLLLSAFFSSSETALTAASRPMMHRMEQNGDKRAATVSRLHDQKENLIGAILLGNNLVNILASALATSVLITLFGEAGVAYATIAMTLLVLIFAEVLPKTYAIKNANTMALTVAPILKVLVAVLSPITNAIQWLVRSVLAVFGVDLTASDHDQEEELRGAIDMHGAEEDGVKNEADMLRSVLDLSAVQVGAIMVHRSSVETLDADMPPLEMMEAMLASTYTRMPLWRDTPDNIVGVLHAKALIRAIQHLGPEPDFSKVAPMELAQPPWFVPEQTPLLDQLEAFRHRREHFALIVDEYGSLLGIVTLEDIIEEIVGQIDDEHDPTIEGVTQSTDGSFTVDGTVTIRDLNREYGWNLPDEEAATLAGLILHEARRIPDVGQCFSFHGLRFDILNRQRQQITSVRVTVPEATRSPAIAEG